MRTIRLPDVDKPISVIGLGTGTPKAFTPATYPRGAALLDAYLAAGGNCLDTAPVYSLGDSERTIGRWLRERQTRDEVILITKGCHPEFDPSDPFGKPWQPRVTPEALYADVNDSLERLQTDFIDIYLLHRDDESVPVQVILNALNAERTRGRIRALGVSNWSTARIAEANAYAWEHGLHGFVISSPSLSLLRPAQLLSPGTWFADDVTREWHTQNQFPLLAWSAQAGGLASATGKEKDAPSDFIVQTYATAENRVRIERARELAAAKGVSVAQVALAFVLAQPFPTIALIGPSTVAHLQDSLGAIHVELSPNELAYLDLHTNIKVRSHYD